MTNEQKEQRFKHPDVLESYLGRWITCLQGPADPEAGTACTFIGSENREHLLAASSRYQQGSSGSVSYIQGFEGSILDGDISSDSSAQYMWWSAFSGEAGWGLYFCQIHSRTGFGKETALCRSGHPISHVKGACLPGGRTAAVWQETQEERIIIQLGIWDAQMKPVIIRTVSDERYDSFRPDIALCSGEHIWIAWDQYHSGRSRYEAVLAESSDDGVKIRFVFSEPARDFNAVKIVECAGEIISIWRCTKEVFDDKGICDRSSYVSGCRVSGRNAAVLTDPAQTEDQRCIGDLREGMLAKQITKGYVGLRRNPQVFVWGDAAYLAWEVRPEASATSVEGMLVCRQIRSDNTVGGISVIHSGGYCYALPKQISKSCSSIPAAHFVFTHEDQDILQIAWVYADSSNAYHVEQNDFSRWFEETAESDRYRGAGPRYSAGGWNLYWADTHCHTQMSPDAEGEPDELIHYAKRDAGLDILGLVDNDFYPHKSVTAAEWEMKKALGRRFSRNGEFLCPPAYEFTYHDADLVPDFNHRCILHFLGGSLLKRTDSSSRDLKGLLQQIQTDESLVYMHHCSYKRVDPQKEGIAEIVSSWRVCLEETDFTLKKLLEGEKIGFIGSSDTHRQVPGRGGALTGVYAESLSPESILDAYRRRRTIASQGSKVFISFWIDQGFIGSEITAAAGEQVTVSCAVEAAENIEYIACIKNGEVLKQVTVNALKGELSCTDCQQEQGTSFYFIKVKLAGDPSLNMNTPGSLVPFSAEGDYPHNLARARGVFAWTSPIWVAFVPG